METTSRDQNTTLRQKIQAYSQFVTNWLAGSKPKNHIPVLDGVRAVACLAVLSYHLNLLARGYNIWPTAHNTNILIAIPAYFGESLAFFGDSGVMLFFLLSSFLLFLPYARALLFDSPWPGLRRFYLRRIFRILPGYYVALFLIALLTHTDFLYPSHWHDLWLFLTFQMDVTLSQQLNGPFWTLAVEFQFYLLLPIIAWFFSLIVRRGSLRWRMLKLTLCLLIMIGWGLFTRDLGLSTANTPNQHSSLLYRVFAVLKLYIYGAGNDLHSGKFFEVFAVGMLICMLYTYTQYTSSVEYWNIRIRRISPLLFTIGIAILTFLSIWHSIVYNFAAYNLIFTSLNAHSATIMSYWLEWQALGYAISYGFCLLALLYGSSTLRRPFEWTALRWIGLISFSLYLWHLPIIFRIADHISYMTYQRSSSPLALDTVFWCWTLIVVVPVSVILYRWIEMPGICIGERLIQRLDGQKNERK